MLNKKGAEMSFNVIIGAVLGILVLVLVGAFFVGKMGGISKSLDDPILNPVSVAQGDCKSKCKLDQSVGSTQYCNSEFKLDADDDGEYETNSAGGVREYRCWEYPIEVLCPGVKDKCNV